MIPNGGARFSDLIMLIERLPCVARIAARSIPRSRTSRPTEDSAAIRRRRVCLTCNSRFTTFERVQLRELTVIKRNGRRVPFDRDKLARSLSIALRKRPVEPERIEQMVSKIVRDLEGRAKAKSPRKPSARP